MVVAIQLVPYGRDHSNPPIGEEPAWDSPTTRELAVRACFDCHSNEVKWPWYSHVAPVSWLVQHDVEEARRHLNFSQWQRPQKHADDAAVEVAEGEMPPWNYLLMHSEARLGGTESQALIAGLERTFGRGSGGDHEDHDD